MRMGQILRTCTVNEGEERKDVPLFIVAKIYRPNFVDPQNDLDLRFVAKQALKGLIDADPTEVVWGHIARRTISLLIHPSKRENPVDYFTSELDHWIAMVAQRNRKSIVNPREDFLGRYEVLQVPSYLRWYEIVKWYERNRARITPTDIRAYKGVHFYSSVVKPSDPYQPTAQFSIRHAHECYLAINPATKRENRNNRDLVETEQAPV